MVIHLVCAQKIYIYEPNKFKLDAMEDILKILHQKCFFH